MRTVLAGESVAGRPNYGKSGKKEYPATYTLWQKMVYRCYRPDDPSYCNYGARGITVCDRWKVSFRNFVEDMGPRPENLTLERINNDAGYSPENCVWATRATQSRNTRRNRMFTHDGKTMCLQDWADYVGIDKSSVFTRLKKGWSLERALLTPPSPGKRKTLPGGGYA